MHAAPVRWHGANGTVSRAVSRQPRKCTGMGGEWHHFRPTISHVSHRRQGREVAIPRVCQFSLKTGSFFIPTPRDISAFLITNRRDFPLAFRSFSEGGFILSRFSA